MKLEQPPLKIVESFFELLGALVHEPPTPAKSPRTPSSSSLLGDQHALLINAVAGITAGDLVKLIARASIPKLRTKEVSSTH